MTKASTAYESDLRASTDYPLTGLSPPGALREGIFSRSHILTRTHRSLQMTSPDQDLRYT
jgi:hypothetical protein